MSKSRRFELAEQAAAMREENKLTAKQRKFAMNVHKGMSDLEAAEKAGYGEGAAVRAVELRNDSRIQLLLDKLSADEVAEPDALSEDFIIRRLLKIAELCAQRGKFLPALKALELLGRHLKMFTDKLEINPVEGLAERLAEARARMAAQDAALYKPPEGDVEIDVVVETDPQKLN